MECPFKYVTLPQEEIREKIRECEGNHVQQVAYSTYMDCFTQICYTEFIIRGSVAWDGNRSWRII